jgi:hypothetical protein
MYQNTNVARINCSLQGLASGSLYMCGTTLIKLINAWYHLDLISSIAFSDKLAGNKYHTGNVDAIRK